MKRVLEVVVGLFIVFGVFFAMYGCFRLAIALSSAYDKQEISAGEYNVLRANLSSDVVRQAVDKALDGDNYISNKEFEELHNLMRHVERDTLMAELTR